MPKAKRDKKVSLTKTDKKGLSNKQSIIEEIQQSVEKYDSIYIFYIKNMRNNKLKEIRTEWKNSRFFFGKNRVMRLGLRNVDVDEKDDNDEEEDGLKQFASHLEGQCGLLFTNDSKSVVLDWFKDYSGIEYAKSGFRATETVVLSEGPLEQFSHAIEPHLRSLGMPTKLERGIVTLHKDLTVCENGKVLTPEQARILKLIGRPMAKFQLFIECCWSKTGGFELFRKRRLIKKVDIEKEKNVPKRLKKKMDKKLAKQNQKQQKVDSENEEEEDMDTVGGGFVEEDNDDSDKMEEN